jgi:hypothetical protein
MTHSALAYLSILLARDPIGQYSTRQLGTLGVCIDAPRARGDNLCAAVARREIDRTLAVTVADDLDGLETVLGSRRADAPGTGLIESSDGITTVTSLVDCKRPGRGRDGCAERGRQ